MLWVSLLAYLAVGVVSGFLAGLLGVGGGMVIVPALLFVFHLLDLPPTFHQHMALGTSMAIISFTAISSLRAHHAKGAVRWRLVKTIAPGIVVGTFIGAQIAGFVSAVALKWFFVVFAYFVAAQMLLDLKPKASRELPGAVGTGLVGTGIGMVSSWVGIGGGSLSVPFMTFCNVQVREAIGTSAAVGFPLAVAGTLGYVASGWGRDLPTGALGFVYLPALAGIVLASFPMAKVGAAVAHRLPVPVLKKIFAALLIVLASRMLVGLI